MSHAFDRHSFGQLVADAERLVTRAADHEQRLDSLADRLEGDGGAVASAMLEAGTSLTGVAAIAAPDHLHTLLTTVQELRVGAAEQRRIAESLRARLVGTMPSNGHSSRPVVLVVDDSKDNREVTALLLEISGFSAITASNGLEGLIAAHYTRPSVVIMDVAMPVLDGVEATRLLRASPVTQRINVIAHTAKLQFERELFEEILPKPASADAMISMVQRYAAQDASQP
jgi:two-component system, cell cycle response regulator DivK